MDSSNKSIFSYSEFKKSKQYQDLKRINTLRRLKLAASKAHWRLFPAKYKLHGDPVLQRVFVLLGKKLDVNLIVETGTFMGYSTSLMAENFQNIPIHTCEISPINYKKASKNLRKYSNVKIHYGTSPEFLESLIDKKILSKDNIGLFFLDAHWLDNWPLEDEIEIITNKLGKAVILIDDFEIPGRENFYHDVYGDKECNIGLIKPRMNKKNKYNLLLPNYGEEIFNGRKHPIMSGYPIIFQNMEKEFNEIKEMEFVKRYFIDASNFLKLK